MSLHIPFDNSYARLPDRFYHKQVAVPVRAPEIIAVNADLAKDLGIDPHELGSADGVAFLAGNAAPVGADPLAQAYAGHQFGGWVPQLGDGRALLLGEVLDASGTRRDIQLKGSGRTPFSRMGDGRAGIGPVLREYIVSEAMHALGVPTTRALAAITTGEPVLREEGPVPGAVLTRVAQSHIRVGTFQYFAARQDDDALRMLTRHVIARHYPEAEDALGLLGAVVARHARLVAQWMGLGFIHGVMNTDNCQIAGETLDYGPCAFMDKFQVDKVFSSIDRGGRYAYNQQPRIAAWNLGQFASCLLPQIDDDEDAAIEKATEAVRGFSETYEDAWLDIFRSKLGLRGTEDGDIELIDGLLTAMEDGGGDFSMTFHGLADGSAAASFEKPEALATWRPAYDARIAKQGDADSAAMARANPAVIPRNHRIEQVITAAIDGDLDPFHRMLRAVTRPAVQDPYFSAPPEQTEIVRRTFCGT